MTDAKELIKVQETDSWEESFKNEAWVSPIVNIHESDDEYILNAIMPEVSRENVKIKIENNSLAIMGRVNYNDVKNRKYIMREMDLGNYYRKFNLSENIDTAKIEAKLENGLLTVKLPKHERVKPRTIDIN